MHGSGSGAAAVPGSPPAVQRRTSSDSNQAHLDLAIEQAESAPAAEGANFDRLVSCVCAAVEEDEGDGDRGVAGTAGSAVSVSRSARRLPPPRKVTSGALRRFVSRRFGAAMPRAGAENGAKGKGSLEDDAVGDAVGDTKEKRPGEPALGGCRPITLGRHQLRSCGLLRRICPICTAGGLVATEDQAVGSVPWSVYGRYFSRMGLPAVSLITGASSIDGQTCCRFFSSFLYMRPLISVSSAAEHTFVPACLALPSHFCVHACLQPTPGCPSLSAVGLLGAQAIYLYSDYWLALWSSKPPAQQQQVASGARAQSLASFLPFTSFSPGNSLNPTSLTPPPPHPSRAALLGVGVCYYGGSHPGDLLWPQLPLLLGGAARLLVPRA